MNLEFFISLLRTTFSSGRGNLTSILTLGIGIFCFLFISNLILYEFSFDKKVSGIYRVENREGSGLQDRNAYTTTDISEILAEIAAPVEEYVRMIPFSEYRSAHLTLAKETKDKPAYFRRAYYADFAAIQFFDLEFEEGIAASFADKNSLIISEAAALEIFGSNWKEAAVGSHFERGKGSLKREFQLVGVFRNREPNTHIIFDALLSLDEGLLTQISDEGYTYLRVPFIDGHNSESYSLRNTGDIHLSEGISNEAEPVGNHMMLLFLAVLAFLILLITVSNYVNSSIIHFIDRCKELGIRKLHGASFAHLVLRLFVELLFINVLAAILGTALFVAGVSTVLHFGFLDYPDVRFIAWEQIMLILLAILTFNVLLSSVYPLVFIRNIGIISALKGAGSLIKSKVFGHAGHVVRGLLVFQIICAILFLSSALMIYKQLQLVDQQPGEREINITGVFPGLSGANQRFTQSATAQLKELSNLRIVEQYAFSNMYKGQISREQKLILNDSSSMFLTVADPSVANARILYDGSYFDRSFGKNPGEIILDKSLAQEKYGFEDSTKVWHNGVHKYNVRGQTTSDEDLKRAYVSGFRYLTYIDLVFNYRPSQTETLDQFLAKQEYVISTTFPYFFLERRTLDQSMNAEREVLRMFILFSIIAIVVASIGLYGLSHFIAQKKSLEVGIRKVHGASIYQIFARLLLDFVVLIFLGSLIAAPIVFYGAGLWLNNYANRIAIDLWIMLVPVAMIMFISLLSVFRKSWEVATLNPVNVLFKK